MIQSLSVQNNTPLALPGYCETNATISSTIETAYRVKNPKILKILGICQLSILNEELSINNKTCDSKRNTDYLTKAPCFKPTFRNLKYTSVQPNFFTRFNFQHSQITQQENEQLAELLNNWQNYYSTTQCFTPHPNLMFEK